MVSSWVYSLILKVPDRLLQILLPETRAAAATEIKMSNVNFDKEPLVSKTWIALRRLDKNGSYPPVFPLYSQWLFVFQTQIWTRFVHLYPWQRASWRQKDMMRSFGGCINLTPVDWDDVWTVQLSTWSSVTEENSSSCSWLLTYYCEQHLGLDLESHSFKRVEQELKWSYLNFCV